MCRFTFPSHVYLPRISCRRSSDSLCSLFLRFWPQRAPPQGPFLRESGGSYPFKKLLIVADVFCIPVAEKNRKDCVGIREVGCRNFRAVGAGELQYARVIPIPCLLWLKDHLIKEKGSHN